MLEPDSTRVVPTHAGPPGGLDSPHALQILMTEHWSLLAARSLGYTEAMSRASIFVAALSGSVIALALVGQATDFGDGFVAFALVLLPVVYFLGVSTVARLGQNNYEDAVWIQGMNRIRNAYLELAPALEPYFVTSHYDDEKGMMQSSFAMPQRPSLLQPFLSIPGRRRRRRLGGRGSDRRYRRPRAWPRHRLVTRARRHRLRLLAGRVHPLGAALDRNSRRAARRPLPVALLTPAAPYPSAMAASRAVSAPLAQLPNALTVLRLALIPLFIVVFVQSDGSSWAAGWIFLIAGVTDQLDGFLARRWHVESRFGKLADPLADRLMLDAAAILLWLDDKLPWYGALIIVLRDVILVGGYRLLMPKGVELSVSTLGKAATWILYLSLGILLVVGHSTEWPLWLFWIGLGMALVAAAQYVVKARREVAA